MKLARFISIVSIVSLALVLASCQSTKVTRVDTVDDVNEFWNDNDITIVCNSLIDECISSPRIARFEAENGRVPTVILGRIRNDSSEAIDTSIISRKMQNAIINSGVMDFVADSGERELLREERYDQAENASMESAKSIGNEEAADFMLNGSVKSVVQYDPSGKKGTRTYYVYAQLQDIETNKIIWTSENDTIKKAVTRSGSKL